ncbi:MAG TPA: HAMP domain-containing sensor histidine kinase [Streptosporangiaceae bacterium]|nr:HAMP domain-containing sensor histidine kinase [Streptosporangiaceae bacterium]
MRLRIIGLVVAISSMVLISFLLPLALVLRTSAADRAVSSATVRAQWMAPLVATLSGTSLQLSVDQVNAEDKAQHITVFLPGGAVLGPPAARSPGVRLAAKGRSFATQARGGVEVLVAVQGLPRGTAVIRAFVPGSQLRAGVARAWLVLGGVGLGLLVLSVAVADQLARSLVRTLRALARVSDLLAAGNLGARAGVAGPPEMRQVSNGLNRLAARIGELLAHERETAADLSHRLRTPLTALRIDAESLHDGAERTQLISDVDGLQRTVNEIIREARRPGGMGVRVVCDASEVIGGRAAFWRPLADDQDRQMAVEIAAGPVAVGVSREDLAACADILLENVFSHTPEGVRFSVRVSHRASGGAWVVVSDAGPGFADPDAARRGRSSAGSTGLGLDIVRRIAESSGGTLTVGRSASGGGAVTAGFGPPAGAAEPARRHRRVRPQLLRRRQDGPVGGWLDDPPPWAAVADQGGYRDHPNGAGA